MLTAPIGNTLTDEQRSRFTGYPVSVPVFEGPLDLLLFLIRRQQLDITDIPIARITGQFLDYLSLMQELDVNVAADFLVMAATLLEIKSRMLLPRPPAELLSEEEEAEDPRAELVRRLLEYQHYKAAAQELQERANEEARVFPRTAIVPHLLFSRPEPGLDGDPDAFSLWTALQEVLARVEEAEPRVREVTRRPTTIRQQMMRILHILGAVPTGVPFVEIFLSTGSEGAPTRAEVIITFLAMLELIRLRRITIMQKALFGPILLRALAPTH
jgi:segregation and condensation protein A